MDTLAQQLSELKKIVSQPFYNKSEFWISFIVGITGVVFSYISYVQAKKAKEAAKAAGHAVKLRSVAIELVELIQRLDTLDSEVEFKAARDFYNEINRRIRKIIIPYINDQKYSERINLINTCLNNIKENLDGVRPNKVTDNSNGITVYYAVESNFSTLSGLLAELSGLFEQNI